MAVKLRLRNAGFRYLGLGFVTYIFIFLTAFIWIFDTKLMPKESFSKISRVHFELSFLDRKVVLTNKSMNGTFVNGVQIQNQIPIVSGDIISVLDFRFEILQLL